MDPHLETERLMEDLARSVAHRTMQYQYKSWGFGEDIALRALYRLGKRLDEHRFINFVSALTGSWATFVTKLTNPDYVAPGVPLLFMFEETSDELYLQAANRLAGLYASFPRRGGIPVHRPDLKPWNSHIWVDCMYPDAPFLVRLGLQTDDPKWIEMGLEHIISYAEVLQTESGLFHHGYDTESKTRSDHAWGRGNGWAMLGLVDTLEVLPRDHPDFERLHRILTQQVDAVVRHQADSGHWHTIIDDPASPIETSNAAFFSAGIWAGIRRGLLSDKLAGAAERAFAAATSRVSQDGTLEGVSEATPIGDKANYYTRKTGMYPWGQGPLLLAILESGRL